MPSNRRFVLLIGLLLLTVGVVAVGMVAASSAQAADGTIAMREAPNPVPSCGPQFFAQTTANSGTTDNALTGVAALAFNDAWAVGYYTDTGGVGQMLIEHWNGSAWSIVPGPNVGTSDNYLQAVSARTSADVWAVGYHRTATGSPFQTLILHYDGVQWTQSASPNAGSVENYLYGVAFVSATDAWAVGFYSNSTNVYRTLTLRWNGGTWMQVPSPTPFLSVAGLRGVVVVSASDVWAVGAQADLSLTIRTYALHWTGSAWSEVTTPNTAGCLLTAVAAVAPGNLWAVGACQSTTYQTLILHYSGGSWAAVSSPNPGSGDNLLGGVAVVSAAEAYAVGGYDDGTATHNLALYWDGVSWTQIFSEDPGSTSNALLSAGAIPNSNGVLAVGSQASGGADRTLAETKVVVVCEPTITPTSPPVSTPTATSTGASTPSATGTGAAASSTGTSTATATAVQPTGTPGSGGTTTPTSTVCPIQYSDVPVGSTFYPFIRCLACRGIINGYADGTFRPNNNVTRGQLSKIVSNSAGFSDPQPNQMFEDVPVGSTFQVYIGRLASRGYISGYACSGQAEPCVPPGNRPYFRPNNNATRGQISKIVSNAAGFSEPHTDQTFQDVPPGSTFYDFIERLASRGVMGGYPCGNPEPCVPPEDRPYFRPNNNATRGQTSKIVANTFFPGCQTPGASDGVRR
jgi:hypothetical protein